MTKPLLGILGGMGPEASVYFYQQIIKKTPVTCDQDHIPTLTYQATFLPDRVKMIQQNRVPEFLEQLKKTLALLYESKITALAVPCNTVHYFLNQIRAEIPVPFFHLIESCMDDLEKKEIDKAILLSTQGTIDTRLYHDEAAKKNIKIITPSKQDQCVISDAIQQIKGGAEAKSMSESLLLLIRNLAKNQTNNIILGCTELPLIFDGESADDLVLIDPMQCLVKEIIAYFSLK